MSNRLSTGVVRTEPTMFNFLVNLCYVRIGTHSPVIEKRTVERLRYILYLSFLSFHWSGNLVLEVSGIHFRNC